MLERNSGAAIWGQIAHSLEREIADGRLKAGERLPSENALAERFGVNRHTVRRAVSELSHRGLLRVEHGRGTFVREQPIEYPINERTRYTEIMLEHGIAADRQLLRVEIVEADRERAKHLGLEVGDPIAVAEFIYYAEERVFSYDVHTFPQKRLPAIADAINEHRGVTAALQACGVPEYRRLWTQVCAELPPESVARALDMASSRPVLKTIGLDVAVSDQPVQFGMAYFIGDRCRLTISGDIGR